MTTWRQVASQVTVCSEHNRGLEEGPEFVSRGGVIECHVILTLLSCACTWCPGVLRQQPAAGLMA